MTALALIHKDRIIEHVSKGGRLDDLHLGISHQAISKALKDDLDYQDAQVSYHAARLDKAEGMIEDADDQVAVARARALHSAYAWRAEREQSRIWGAKQDQVTSGVTVIINTRDYDGTIIDGQAINSTHAREHQADDGGDVPAGRDGD